MNKITQFLLTWLIGFIILTVLDIVWLGYVIQDIIVQDFQGLVTVTSGSIDILLGAELLV